MPEVRAGEDVTRGRLTPGDVDPGDAGLCTSWAVLDERDIDTYGTWACGEWTWSPGEWAPPIPLECDS